MTKVCCWWCGVEPDGFIEDQRLCQPEPHLIPVWPAGDHTHTAVPPTPEQLTDAGHAALRRIRENP